MLNTINDVFDAIDACSGTNAKIAVLKQVKENPELETHFLRIITAALNPYVNFYIKKFTITSEGLSRITDTESLNVLASIAKRKVTGNKAKNMLEILAENLQARDQIILTKIINKKLDNGVSVSTINKIWPNHIPVFNVMLCHPLNERSIKEIQFPCYVQIKYDAARVAVIVKDNTVRYFTRNGKEYLIENPALDDEFIRLATIQNNHTSANKTNTGYVFDGELYKSGANRVESNSIGTKLVRGTASKEDHAGVSIVLWDVVRHDEFMAGRSTIAYRKRLENLRIMKINNPNIGLADTRTFTDLESIREYNSELIAKGEEGVIIKNMGGFWEAKRSYQAIKMKEELETELRVIGVAEGLNKYVNMCGALECASSDGLVTVSVGTGLSDVLREEYSPKNANNIVGKIITVRHNGIITARDGTHSLYLPRFVEVRFDKDEADDLTKIQNEGK